ncbi:MAG: cytochrome P460 family protein [Planctomycetes bacterium]|nr:cytochrome P460 family protein [Planctomycetota bacterium]
MSRALALVLVVASFATFVGCQRERNEAPPLSPVAHEVQQAAPIEAGDELPEEVLDQLAVYVREFPRWQKVDDLAHWAPELCRRPPEPAQRVSQSKDEETHGKKIYYLYARERAAYLRGGAEAEAIGQVLVKESFEALPMPSGAAHAFEQGEAREHFVMARFDPKIPGTDDGWVYAVFSPGSSKPVAAGKLESCMSCHVREGKGRLFGMAEAERAELAFSAQELPPQRKLERLLAEIPKSYEHWSRVDEQVRISPLDCDLPDTGNGRLSQSRDEATHGRKLYYLYARDRAGYLLGGELADHVGQIVVKEAWQPQRLDPAQGIHLLHPKTLRPPSAEIDGVRYETGEPAGLFVMLKVDPATPNTDDGWVYATYPAGSAKPSEFGRIASCMECHVREGHGRLFGLGR